MKFSNYFHHTRRRNDRKDIDIKWIEATYSFPEKELIQLDGRIRRWKYIKEVDRYLRVVILEDKKTVHNAFLTGRSNKIIAYDNYLF